MASHEHWFRSLDNAATGIVTTMLLAAFGGSLLAGKAFAQLGAVFGAFFAVPFGIVYAIISTSYRCSNLITSIAQFLGAIMIGGIMVEEFRRDAAIYYPLGGQIFGGAIAIVVMVKFRKPSNCCCISCGYDLTGNVSGVCPECGTPIPENQLHHLIVSANSEAVGNRDS